MSELVRLSGAVSMLSASCAGLGDDRTGVVMALSTAARALDDTPEAAGARAAIAEADRLWQAMSIEAHSAARLSAAFAAGLAG